MEKGGGVDGLVEAWRLEVSNLAVGWGRGSFSFLSFFLFLGAEV